MNTKKLLSLLSAMIIAMVSQISFASSDSISAVKDQKYKDECGACHFAYQPEFLPERSWRKLMSTLDDHFGENAELAEADRQALTDYLVRHAGTGKGRSDADKFVRSIRGNETPLRISRLPYFLREHDEIPRRVIESKELGGLSKCQACHRRAGEGSYREREIDIPGYGRWDD